MMQRETRCSVSDGGVESTLPDWHDLPVVRLIAPAPRRLPQRATWAGMALSVLVMAAHPLASAQSTDAEQGSQEATTSIETDGEAGDAAPESLQGLNGRLESREVTIGDGDTLSAIAKRELGSVGMTVPLAEFNGISVADTLQPGQTLLIPVLVPDIDEVARVIFVKGFATRDGEPLTQEAEIIVGDLLETGPDGFVSLEFSSGSVVNLQPDTSASITRLSCLENDARCIVEIEAGGGSLNSDVEPRSGQPLQFRISTPFAAAAVRGTIFDFSADAGTLLAGVTEGEVVVQALQEEVSLPSGFGSVTQEGEAPGEPIPLLRAPVFRNIPARLAPGDVLGWFGLPSADGYDATLSIDSAGVQSVASFASDDATLSLGDGVDAGDYYVALRAIDGNGLRGYASTARLTIAELAADIEPVEATVAREGNEYFVTVIDPPDTARGFEIQVSTSPEFDDPLGIDVTANGEAIVSIDTDTLYARARTLIDPTTVSAFGPVASSGN